MTFTGYIYKITGACGLVYIGSTVDKITRKSQHKTDKNNSCSSRLLLKPLQFEIIDTREYTLVKTLQLMEQFYLDNTNTINQRRAYTNNKKYMRNYREINSEKLRCQDREYRENNKERIKKRKKEQIKCECGCITSRHSKARHKKSKKHIKLINLLNSAV